MNRLVVLAVIGSGTTVVPIAAGPVWARWTLVGLVWLGRAAGLAATSSTLAGSVHWAAVAKLVSVASNAGAAGLTRYLRHRGCEVGVAAAPQDGDDVVPRAVQAPRDRGSG